MFFQLGLDAKETAVYLALLEEGAAPASRIAGYANIDRGTAYSVLGRLVAKGFAGVVVENDVRKYSATEPEKLLDVLEERKSRLSEALPILAAMRKTGAGEAPRVTVYNGAEGFKTIMNDMLRHGEDLLGLGYTAAGPRFLGSWFDGWQKRRVKKKIWRRYIASKKMAATEAARAPLTTIKPISDELVTPSSTIIYADRVAILFAGQKTFTGVLIESKEIAESYRNFFNALWKKL